MRACSMRVGEEGGGDDRWETGKGDKEVGEVVRRGMEEGWGRGMKEREEALSLSPCDALTLVHACVYVCMQVNERYPKELERRQKRVQALQEALSNGVNTEIDLQRLQAQANTLHGQIQEIQERRAAADKQKQGDKAFLQLRQAQQMATMVREGGGEKSTCEGGRKASKAATENAHALTIPSRNGRLGKDCSRWTQSCAVHALRVLTPMHALSLARSVRAGLPQEGRAQHQAGAPAGEEGDADSPV
jgi:hypothetical protein